MILVYHHVADDTPASTSISPDLFARHLDYLDQHKFNVWPLSKIVSHLTKGINIPKHTVALTFDDAYQSVYHRVFPMMQQRGWPFTLFVNTQALDRGQPPYLTWAQLAEMHQAGVEVGNHSHTHAHLVHQLVAESDTQYEARIKQDIQTAQDRIEEHLGPVARIFAYPYGEFTPRLSTIVNKLGYVGVGQHSGAVGAGVNLMALPRFPMSGPYADLDRFAQRIITQPLGLVPDIANGYILPPDKTSLTLRLTTDEPHAGLNCYASGQGKMILQHTPDHLLLTPVSELSVGRNKFNCTAPDPAQPGVYRWWSFLVMRPPDNTSWYDF